LCTAAESYVTDNEGLIDKTKPGTSVTIKLQKLSDANLIEATILNPYYSNSLFKKSDDEKYYSMDNSVRLTVLTDGTYGCEMVDNSMDITSPELRLTGDAEVSLVVGTEFEDPGFTATDDYDGDISSNVVRSGNVNVAKAGEYTITYSVSDSAGNVTTKTRKIIVSEYKDQEYSLGTLLDKITPMITLKGANPYCLVKGEKYVEPGATATDNVDGDITNRISVTNKVTGNILGSSRIKYTVQDTYGNEATAYRAVVVMTECPAKYNEGLVANTPPVVNVLGSIAITIKKGEAYVDKGANATDKEDGDLTNRIITDVSDVNVNANGVYKVIYKVTDSAGATTSAVRTVTVKDEVISGTPSVRWTSSKTGFTVVVGKGSDTMIASPTAVDENNVAVTVTRTIENSETSTAVNSINWNAVGKYKVTYTAIHGSGSIRQPLPIIVNVIADTVTIGGNTTVNVIKRAVSCDLNEADIRNGGVTFTTIENAQPFVSITATQGIACQVGTYEVTVSANTSTSEKASKKITVIVAEGTAPPINVGAPSKVKLIANSAIEAGSTDYYNAGSKWVGGNITAITVGFSSTPATGTEISHFEVTDNCAGDTALAQIAKTTGTSSGTYQWTKEGTNNVCFRAVSTVGVKGPWSDPVRLYIDRTAPTVTFTHTWADDVNDWYNTGSLVVKYSATDANSQSGLLRFEYTYDDVKGLYGPAVTNPKTTNETTGSLTVYEWTEQSTKPILYVYVRAVDGAGNPGEWTPNPAFLNMDTIKPLTPTLTVSGNNTSVVKVLAKFTDGTSARQSGFGKMIYTVKSTREDTAELVSTSFDTATSTSTITVPEYSNRDMVCINVPTGGTTTVQAVNKDKLPDLRNQNPNLVTFGCPTTIDKTVKVWAVDKAGNRSDANAETTVKVSAISVGLAGIDLKNGTTAIADGAACSASTVYVGTKINLTATPVPADSDTNIVYWSSSNAAVASITETGEITAASVGTATITAKIGPLTKTCTVAVKSQVSPTPSSCWSRRAYDTQWDCEHTAGWGNDSTKCVKSDGCWVKA
jgi:hypothetical protein